MNKRTDYEHEELDLDNNYYWFTNSDVQTAYKNPKLKNFLKWWNESEKAEGYYYKGTRLYWTFEGVKYYETWTFYNEGRLEKAIKLLKELGAENIQINYGELD